MKFKNFGNIDWAVKVCQLFGNFYSLKLRKVISVFLSTSHKSTLQMFAGIYGGFAGKSECGDFKFMGIACNPQSL